jgi:hypothetical protein
MLPDKLFEQMDELIELELKKVELLRQLKKAYMLADVIGQHPNQIKGKLTMAVHTYGAPLYVRPWRTQELVVRLDGEEVARKKLIDVPLDLWPEDIRAEYERQQKRNMRKAHAQV